MARSRGRAVGVSVIGIVATASMVANADPVALSKIPLSDDDMPERIGTTHRDDLKRGGDGVITALDQPVCVAPFDVKRGKSESPLAGGADVPWRNAVIEMERVALEPEPALKRMVLDDTGHSKEWHFIRWARIPLVQIVTDPLPVFAYRTKTAVKIVVLRGFNSPEEAFTSPAGTRECGLSVLELSVGGQVANALFVPPQKMTPLDRWAPDLATIDARQFSRKRPPPLPQWNVNASLSKTSRDPEPLLSVVVTLQREDNQ
jgi:hypothetical protein